jgi:hypothetical protein
LLLIVLLLAIQHKKVPKHLLGQEEWLIGVVVTHMRELDTLLVLLMTQFVIAVIGGKEHQLKSELPEDAMDGSLVFVIAKV